MKKRIIKDYKKLPDAVKDAIKVKYADGGLIQDIIEITNAHGVRETVFEFLDGDIDYLVRLPEEDFEDFDMDDSFTGDDLFDE